MYTLVYYYTETTGSEVIKRKYQSNFEFRLRRNALHYLLEIVQNYYREEEGFGTEQIVGGINCYKSEKVGNGKRKVIDLTVKVEKVQKKVGR